MTCQIQTRCRLCQGDMTTIINLGQQALAGQFPAEGEPTPPVFPLELARCLSCDLVQLRHTVDPELMFRDYWYRSGVTATMRMHLGSVAEQAVQLLNRRPESVLDVGGNDNTLLMSLPVSIPHRVSVDPCSVPRQGEEI